MSMGFSTLHRHMARERLQLLSEPEVCAMVGGGRQCSGKTWCAWDRYTSVASMRRTGWRRHRQRWRCAPWRAVRHGQVKRSPEQKALLELVGARCMLKCCIRLWRRRATLDHRRVQRRLPSTHASPAAGARPNPVQCDGTSAGKCDEVRLCATSTSRIECLCGMGTGCARRVPPWPSEWPSVLHTGGGAPKHLRARTAAEPVQGLRRCGCCEALLWVAAVAQLPNGDAVYTHLSLRPHRPLHARRPHCPLRALRSPHKPPTPAT